MKTINLLDTLNRVERELTRLSSELGDWDASEQKTLDDVRALIAMHADQPATGKAVRFEDVREFVREARQATQAGTPYSVEQDGINALHLRVSDLENRAESIKKIIHTAKLQLAAGDHFDADLTLELALRELQ